MTGAQRQARYRARKLGIGPNDDASRPHRSRGLNAAAIETTIAALQLGGHLEAVDAALVAATRTTAAALDRADTPYVAAIVVRAHLEVVARLLDRPSAAPDAIDLFVAGLRQPSSSG